MSRLIYLHLQDGGSRWIPVTVSQKNSSRQMIFQNCWTDGADLTVLSKTHQKHWAFYWYCNLMIHIKIMQIHNFSEGGGIHIFVCRRRRHMLGNFKYAYMYEFICLNYPRGVPWPFDMRIKVYFRKSCFVKDIHVNSIS